MEEKYISDIFSFKYWFRYAPKCLLLISKKFITNKGSRVTIVDKTSCKLRNNSPPPTSSYNYQYWILIFNNSPKCASHLTVITSETDYPLSNCAHIYCFVSENIQQTLMSIVFFFEHERMQWNFCFMENFMSNAILPDYCSVATCNKEKKNELFM